jgi:hypothetical protein
MGHRIMKSMLYYQEQEQLAQAAFLTRASAKAMMFIPEMSCSSLSRLVTLCAVVSVVSGLGFFGADIPGINSCLCFRFLLQPPSNHGYISHVCFVLIILLQAMILQQLMLTATLIVPLHVITMQPVLLGRGIILALVWFYNLFIILRRPLFLVLI